MLNMFLFFPRYKNVMNCLHPKPDALFKLICFPWAGGGSFYFAKWGEKMPDSVEGTLTFTTIKAIYNVR